MSELWIFIWIAVLALGVVPVMVFLCIKFGVFAFLRGRRLYQDFEERNQDGKPKTKEREEKINGQPPRR